MNSQSDMGSPIFVSSNRAKVFSMKKLSGSWPGFMLELTNLYMVARTASRELKPPQSLLHEDVVWISAGLHVGVDQPLDGCADDLVRDLDVLGNRLL